MVVLLESKLNNAIDYFLKKFSNRNYQRRIQQLNAIRVIQRNGRALMKIRNWKWWRLYTKIKPLLQVTGIEEEVKQKQEEIRRLKADMESRTLQAQETEQQLQQVQQERNVLNERLTHANELLVELDEVISEIFENKNYFILFKEFTSSTIT